MRAEAQAHVDQINAALALLRRFLDWDRALRRLDELNTQVEDPDLWNDPKAAQEVMRERRRLEEAINAATSDADVKARFAAIGADATPAEPDRLGERLVRERALVQQLIRDTGISLS